MCAGVCTLYGSVSPVVRMLVQELGLPGVEIGSHINRWNWDLPQPEPAEVWDLDAPELQCVFAAAEELGAAVFVHPWDMDQSPRMKKYWMPWLVGEYHHFARWFHVRCVQVCPVRRQPLSAA